MKELVFIIMLSLALAMDAFAVSMTIGISGITKKNIDRFKTAITFGIFQGLLFFLGTLSIYLFNEKITTFNTYVATFLLAILGIKMIKESLTNKEGKCPNDVCIEANCKKSKCSLTGNYRFLTIKLLVIYGIATSIDAFAAGISFSIMYNKIYIASLSIGLITFILSFFGTILGFKIKGFIGNKANLFGGIILIILAIKALF